MCLKLDPLFDLSIEVLEASLNVCCQAELSNIICPLTGLNETVALF